MKKKIIMLGILLLVSGCVESDYAVKKEPLVLTQLPQPVQVTSAPGSLWPGESNRNMLFADNKARYLNDIVTIVISESSTGSNDASTNTSRATSTNAGISALFGIDTSIINKNPNMGSSISVGGASANSLKGAGDTSRSSKMTAQIAGRVIKVFENGNMVIEGRRQVTVNAEDQYMVITGIIRPDDVTPENFVHSRNISDARIVYTGMGVINDKSHPGWGTRILDWVWPF
jgi:flagellar L-ring protein precursor FlgH